MPKNRGLWEVDYWRKAEPGQAKMVLKCRYVDAAGQNGI